MSLSADPDTRVRVAHVGPDPAEAGGMPAVVAGLLRSPLSERYRMEAIPSWRDTSRAGRALLFARSLGALVRWCAGPGPRIVHVHIAARGSFYRKTVVVEVAKAMRRPVVLQLHAGPGDLEDFFDRLGPLRRRAFARAFGRADRVLSVSASAAEVLRERLADVEVEVVRNAPPPAAAAERPAEPAAEPGILYLGGFADPAKGGAVLLDALPALLERAPAARVVLAGPGELDDGLPDRARWLGWLDEEAKARAFAGSEVFAMPSISEGLPVTLLEAMSHGLAIVATAVGGIGEILTADLDAVLVEPGDPDLLAAALASVVADPDRRRRLGAAAAERARRLADDDVYARLEAVYESVL
ncbi:MAG TPA: glycosyltransferase family 4 protein [Solirubrobacterales bacterium]